MQQTALSASQPAFALAKIQAPRQRSGLVERPTLERMLAEALLQNRLTLLVAPAGYGKTAALTRQVELLPDDCALAWLSADDDDRLPRFLACLTAALAPYDLPWRVAPSALATLALSEGGVRAVASEIVNALALAAQPRGVIMLDDAHRIDDPQVFELLQAVLNRLPEQWGIAIASRIEPPLSLARWRASGELAELRQYDLRFNESEVDALLSRSAAFGVPQLNARQLLDHTDGWAAGLRLSLAGASAGRYGASSAAQRHLFDYFASEVLDDMPVELRGFLLRCSVLPELTAARCAALTGVVHAARLLEEIERRGLFVAVLDADELTLRLHDLFRDFLDDRLQRDLPDELPTLLRRAAASEPDLVRAVGHLMRARAWGEAARLLDERGPTLVMTGNGAALEQMLAQFPAPEFASRSELEFLRGLAAFPAFDFDQMVASMRRASEGFAAAGREQDAALAAAYQAVGMENTAQLEPAVQLLADLRRRPLAPAVRTFVSFGSAWAAYSLRRTEEVAQHLAEMLEALEAARDPQVWDRCFFLSLFTGVPGVRLLLERFVEGALRLTGDRPTQLRAGTLHIRTWLAFGRGELDTAARHLALADDDCRWLGHPRSLMTENWMAHTIIDAVRGDRDAALAAANANRIDLEQVALSSNRLTHEYEEIFTHIRACWLLGEAHILRERELRLQRIANPHEWAMAGYNRRFASAMVALLDERLDDARTLLRPLADDIERACFFPATQARVILADVECRLGDLPAAALALRPWLDAAHGGGDLGGALLAGLASLRRLAGAAWGTRLDARDVALLADLVRRIERAGAAAAECIRVDDAQRAAGLAGAPRPSRAATEADPALAALTAREREVLERMAAGDSNKLIARRFDLSPHTVKRHVANILDKLDARTRGEAAARWRG